MDLFHQLRVPLHQLIQLVHHGPKLLHSGAGRYRKASDYGLVGTLRLGRQSQHRVGQCVGGGKELSRDIGQPLQGTGAKPVLDLGEREMGEVAQQVELRIRPLTRLRRHHAQRPEDMAARRLQRLAGVGDDAVVRDGRVLPHLWVNPSVLDDEAGARRHRVLTERMRQRRFMKLRVLPGRVATALEVLPIAVDEGQPGRVDPQHLLSEAGDPIERLLCPGVQQTGVTQLGKTIWVSDDASHELGVKNSCGCADHVSRGYAASLSTRSPCRSSAPNYRLAEVPMTTPRISVVRRAVVLVAVLVVVLAVEIAPAASAGWKRPESLSTTSMVLTRAKNPARTVVTSSTGTWIATLTDRSRTVALAGPARTLTEPNVEARITSTTWVRLLPTPFTGAVDQAWLAAATADRSPDVLATALEYVVGAATTTNGSLVISSDASYGPMQADGTRQEGSDWNDYQGVDATYASGVDRPEPAQIGSLDCSGFLRMLLGIRYNIPLTLDPDGVALPRRAVQMAASAPGMLVIRDRGTQVTDFRRLQPGDLVFFDAASDDGTDIDHAGMYLGVDDGGRHRFVSSRKSIDGPTMGDYGGRSVLDGTGLYATAFRAVRRL